MSFRRAADHTLIAQLVGRMVRTPLARRVEDNEFLGSVALFLPHYDEAGLKAIVERLEDPDTGSPVRVERRADLVLYGRAKDEADLFDALSNIPTYVLDNTRRQANTRRLLRWLESSRWTGSTWSMERSKNASSRSTQGRVCTA